MRPSVLRFLAVLLVAAVAAGIGLAGHRWLTPERLRQIVERRLSELTQSPASVGQVRLALGVGLQLEAEDVRLWPRGNGHGLRIGHAGLGLEPLGLLTGRLRARRLILRDAVLEVEQDEAGAMWPRAFRFLDRSAPGPAGRSASLLRPVIAMEAALRWLLARPYLSDHLEVLDSRVLLALRSEADPVRLSRYRVDIDEGTLHHSALSGDAELALAGRLSDDRGLRVGLGWAGLRDRGDGLRVQLRLDEFDLAQALPYLQPGGSAAGLAGRASGRIDFRSSSPGFGQLDLQLDLRELHASLAAPAELPGLLREGLRAARLTSGASLQISPSRLELVRADVESGDLRMQLSGWIGRPLVPSSGAELELTFRDLEVARLRSLLEWWDGEHDADLGPFVTPVVQGRLRTFRARGRASVARWEDFFAGRTPIAAMGFEAESDFEGVVLAVGETDRIESLSGRASWSRERFELEEARGQLNGEPLPLLDLRFDGLRHMLDGAPEWREMRGGAPLLAGLEPLWRLLLRDEEEEAAPPLRVGLQIEWLLHPAFLWPLHDLRAEVASGAEGVHVDLEEGRWAGVPISGQSDWLFEPEPRVRVALQAGETGSDPDPPAEPRAWARGRFEIGPVDHERWQQTEAHGRFRAVGRTILLSELEVQLLPTGELRGAGRIDLDRDDALPYQLSAELVGGDLGSLAAQIHPQARVASGRLDGWGSAEGSLRPGDSLFRDLTALVELSASEGSIYRSLPPVVAVALASQVFNPFAERESIRYGRAATLLQFSGGSISTRELSIDGPDMRVMASGRVDLLGAMHRLDAEVALFLFRQIDRAVGGIPLVNLLLLGPNKSLVAAYFELSGPWGQPETRLVPLKSVTSGGPASLVFEGVPSLVRQGLEALGNVFGNGQARPPPPASVEPDTRPSPPAEDS